MVEDITEVTPPIQEKAEPVQNHVDLLNKLFYAVKIITRPSKHEDIERPLFEKALRARLYKQIKSLPRTEKDKKEEIIKEAHRRDEIFKKYLYQGEVSVNLNQLGEQKAKYVTIIPPESLRENRPKSPIFLIPGISNDIESVDALTNEIAFLGREITVIAYPGSYKGKITPQFAEAVEKDKAFGLHVEFFKNAIKKLDKNGHFELWGLSMGAPIIASILNDPEFQKKTENAVFLMPASSVNQSLMNLYLGIVNEFRFLKEFHTFPLWNWTKESKIPREDEAKKLSTKVYKALLKKVCQESHDWQNVRVKKGGNIIIMTGGRDYITKSYQKNSDFLKNPQVKLLSLKGAYHITPIVKPDKIIPLIFGVT